VVVEEDVVVAVPCVVVGAPAIVVVGASDPVDPAPVVSVAALVVGPTLVSAVVVVSRSTVTPGDWGPGATVSPVSGSPPQPDATRATATSTGSRRKFRRVRLSRGDMALLSR
jgi:hypothetical protein